MSGGRVFDFVEGARIVFIPEIKGQLFTNERTITVQFRQNTKATNNMTLHDVYFIHTIDGKPFKDDGFDANRVKPLTPNGYLEKGAFFNENGEVVRLHDQKLDLTRGHPIVSPTTSSSSPGQSSTLYFGRSRIGISIPKMEPFSTLTLFIPIEAPSSPQNFPLNMTLCAESSKNASVYKNITNIPCCHPFTASFTRCRTPTVDFLEARIRCNTPCDLIVNDVQIISSLWNAVRVDKHKQHSKHYPVKLETESEIFVSFKMESVSKGVQKKGSSYKHTIDSFQYRNDSPKLHITYAPLEKKYAGSGSTSNNNVPHSECIVAYVDIPQLNQSTSRSTTNLSNGYGTGKQLRQNTSLDVPNMPVISRSRSYNGNHFKSKSADFSSQPTSNHSKGSIISSTNQKSLFLKLQQGRILRRRHHSQQSSAGNLKTMISTESVYTDANVGDTRPRSCSTEANINMNIGGKEKDASLSVPLQPMFEVRREVSFYSSKDKATKKVQKENICVGDTIRVRFILHMLASDYNLDVENMSAEISQNRNDSTWMILGKTRLQLGRLTRSCSKQENVEKGNAASTMVWKIEASALAMKFGHLSLPFISISRGIASDGGENMLANALVRHVDAGSKILILPHFTHSTVVVNTGKLVSEDMIAEDGRSGRGERANSSISCIPELRRYTSFVDDFDESIPERSM